jgi:RHS repeat-associated protein
MSTHAAGITYDAYGAHDASGVTARTAFAGQAREADTGWYLLGERPYSPTLRRFLAPDTLSPFASGGINRYAYCGGDPINRIDPTGHTPWQFGIFSTLKRSIHLRNAGGSASTDSASIDAARTTPGTLASGVASIADTVSVTSAVVPTSMTSGPPRANGLHGRAESKPASEGAALAPPKRRKTIWETREEALTGDNNLMRGRPRVIMHQGIKVLNNGSVPSSRIGARQDSLPYVLPQWLKRVHSTNRNSIIVAADSVTYALEYDSLMNRLQELGVNNFTLYTGSHGSSLGQNWGAQSRTNLAPDRAMFERDRTYMEKAATKFGMTIDVVDIGGWTSDSFRQAISRDGVHALAMCFGMADPNVREEFNLPTVTLYNLNAWPGT